MGAELFYGDKGEWVEDWPNIFCTQSKLIKFGIFMSFSFWNGNGAIIKMPFFSSQNLSVALTIQIRRKVFCFLIFRFLEQEVNLVLSVLKKVI